MLTFQQMIQTLTEFWETKGCIIHQGHDLEVGAGTFNPSTFLRCLGPEPYNTAYVEPSRRPSDGRYGENPNRLQLFHQFQVILKPSPAEVQTWYLESLLALGLDLSKHDIRFVHDDWESPTLGAWGLGWEVWCDGMEITQFTYFQAVGSIPLHPISVEITYGLERLAMFLQNVENVFDVRWNEKMTLRDLSHQNEVEWSAYNFEEASSDMWFRHFADYEKEAKDLIGKHLPIPAYDFVLKASHAFNILDARGVISVTERTGYIGRIRDLARLVATEYLASREKKGFPLLKPEKKKASSLKKISFSTKFDSTKKKDFLLEIGSEQLPATFVPIGMRHLEMATRKLLEESELAYDRIEVFGTPQRLAVLVYGLSEGSSDKSVERKGPPVESAFDKTGQPTQQGAGFLRQLQRETSTLDKIRKKEVPGLEIRLIKDVEYLFSIYTQQGRSTMEILSTHLPKLITDLEFPKKMRWADLEISYARPIRWIAALYGKQVIPFQVGNTSSGSSSWGHAQLLPEPLKIQAPKEYLSTLKKAFVLADPEERKASILRQMATLSRKLQGSAVSVEKVLPQVLFLTEWPQLTYGLFDESFLKIPKEVLISEMVEHQKYFPLVDTKGQLKNMFLITADQKPNATIRSGNQKVLSARLSDGSFLYEQDRKNPLGSFNEKLKMMTFQKELGSMFEKVLRIERIAKVLNKHLSLADSSYVTRASLLAKADLASNLVCEFPELQGTIGKYYAKEQGEPEEVAIAIEEHWMPRSESSPLPKTPTGIILSLADKIDNLLGYFRVGLKPTSSSDPYALRRQTLGMLKILIENGRSIHLPSLLKECAECHPGLSSQGIDEILAFITSRAKTVFEDCGFKKDTIEAVLQGSCINPYDQFCKTQALSTFRTFSEFTLFFEVYKRVKGFLESGSIITFHPELADHPAEKRISAAIDKIEPQVNAFIQSFQYLEAFRLIATLQDPLSAFLDQVKILVEDPKTKDNRIALLQKVFALFTGLMDLRKLQEGV